MSGIAGIINLKNSHIDKALLHKMVIPLIKKGAEASPLMTAKMMGIAHTRLSTNQPHSEPLVSDKTGDMVALDGTLYNHDELQRKLASKGYSFTTNSDAEVILHAYREWGLSAIEKLQGVFAFALWDRLKEEMHLVRDRMGTKPLYYAQNYQQLYFASTMQSLLATEDINTNIDPIALNFMYTLHAVVPAPHTIFEGVKKVQPAHILTITKTGEHREKRYWQLSATRKHLDWSHEEWKAAIEEKLTTAVVDAMNFSENPVGMLLSGGLDSTLITALASEQGFKNIDTFSVGFEDTPEEEGSEFRFSDPFVEKYQTNHHKFLIPNHEVLLRLPDAVGSMSEPLFGQDAVAFYLLAENVKGFTNIVQSGQGADELFAGYFWYALMNESTESDPLKRFGQYYFDRSHDEWLTLINKKYHTNDSAGDYIRAQLTKPGADTFLDQVLRLDVTSLIIDDPVKRVDNMTRANALEARMPFMDQGLVELAMAMPIEYKLRHNGKGILKEIARGRVPDAIIDRPKAYFPMPALKYVRGEFYDMMRDLLTSSRARERGLFNENYVNDLLAHPEAESSFTNIKGSKLWHCALLEMWLQGLNL